MLKQTSCRGFARPHVPEAGPTRSVAPEPHDKGATVLPARVQSGPSVTSLDPSRRSPVLPWGGRLTLTTGAAQGIAPGGDR